MAKKRAISIVIILIAAALFSYVHFSRERPRITRTFNAMGNTPITITAYRISPKIFYSAVHESKTLTANFEETFSRYKDDSEVSKINSALGPEPQLISDDVLELLSLSQKWNLKTGGAFDITIPPLSLLWDEAARKQELPKPSELTSAIASVGMNLLKIDADDSKISTGTDGVQLDFAAIAKGYLVDTLADEVQDIGINRGIIDVGGHVRCWGKKIFKIGIQDPTTKRKGAYMGMLKTGPTGLGTSSNFQRYYEVDGKKHSHILNPKTGLPVDGLISVTIKSEDAADADALATAISIMGREKGVKLLKELGKTYAIMVEKDKNDHVTVWYSKELESELVLYGRWSKDTKSF